jgi:hypothetical protein
MTTWTERYLVAVLKSIPEGKRAEVERELTSSIADAIEERVGAGEDRLAAERAVLEGLGEPSQLASGYTGRPNYLLGPELFPLYREFLPRLVAIIVPLAAVGLATARLLGGGNAADAVSAAISGAISVAIQLVFWTTVTFVFIERADAARDARAQMLAKAGRWTVDRLPDPSPGRVTAGDTVGEVITSLITIGALLFLRGISIPDASGAQLPLLDPQNTNFLYPLLIGVLLANALIHVVVFAIGRWTMPMFSMFAIVEVAFAAPLVWAALNGTLINPAFASEVGYPPLADGNGPAMLAIAVVTTLVTGWEIVSAFLKARGTRPLGSLVRELRSSI